MQQHYIIVQLVHHALAARNEINRAISHHLKYKQRSK